MREQLITLAATVVGALIGLLAPMLTEGIGRRTRHRDGQRAVAESIMDIFAGGEPLTVLLGGRESPPRRRLYLLALRLDSASAREACLRVVALAGGEDPAEVQNAWDTMINEVGAVFRAQR